MTNNIFEKIDLYFDDELNKNEEPFLFSELSTNPEARNYFRQMQMLKLAVKNSEEDFPPELDRRILSGISAQPVKNYFDISRFTAYAASAAAVILIVLSVFMISEFREYRYKLAELDTKVKEQNMTIEMLYNSFPTVTVKPTMNN